MTSDRPLSEAPKAMVMCGQMSLVSGVVREMLPAGVTWRRESMWTPRSSPSTPPRGAVVAASMRIGSDGGSAAGGGDGDIARQLEARAGGESGELIDLLQQEVDFGAGKPAENECAGIAEERFDAVHAHARGERAQDELEHAGEEQARPYVVEGGGQRCRRRRRENGEARRATAAPRWSRRRWRNSNAR